MVYGIPATIVLKVMPEPDHDGYAL